MLDGWIDNLHFDEAWLPHAAFHKFYGMYHAMGKGRPRPKEAVVYSTQSIHKLLAGISQASHVLVQDSQNVKLDRNLFNEAYLMHTSTSPQYAIIASCDVAAATNDAMLSHRRSRVRACRGHRRGRRLCGFRGHHPVEVA